MMKTYLAIASVALVASVCQASPGPLFIATANGNQLEIRPSMNRTYPKMGIKITNGYSVTGCTPFNNGYCIFSASPTAPAVLTLSGGAAMVQGTVCLNGVGPYSCQRISFNQTASLCTGANPVCGVFVSSTQSTGNIGGLAGGNATCQTLASTAGLSGTWAAWLSDNVTNASVNIGYNAATTFVRAAEPNVTIAPPGTLLTGNLANAISKDENGADVVTNVWTGTDTGGALGIATCSQWTTGSNLSVGDFGGSSFINFRWTANDSDSCNNVYALYCFEVPA